MSDGPTTDAPRQLSLLQWDLLAVGRGLKKLTELDFDQARTCFTEVLAVLPTHPDALRGMHELDVWEATLEKTGSSPPQQAISLLWEEIEAYGFPATSHGHELRRGLIRRLLAIMTAVSEDFWLPPDLCRGRLLLELNAHADAAQALRRLLTHHPRDGRLHGLLALALRAQGRREAADALTIALLLAPQQLPQVLLEHSWLRDIIAEHDPALAPVYGFLAGVLPLPDKNFELPSTPAARLVALLHQAEQARRSDDHPAMIEARRALKKLAPDILTRYLDWLQGRNEVY